MEQVICAAVRAPDGYIIRGHRHNDALRTMRDIPRYEDAKPPCGDDQGFVTSENRYVTRKEAYEIQIAAGIPSILSGINAYLHGECYSEDLY